MTRNKTFLFSTDVSLHVLHHGQFAFYSFCLNCILEWKTFYLILINADLVLVILLVMLINIAFHVYPFSSWDGNVLWICCFKKAFHLFNVCIGLTIFSYLFKRNIRWTLCQQLWYFYLQKGFKMKSWNVWNW